MKIWPRDGCQRAGQHIRHIIRHIINMQGCEEYTRTVNCTETTIFMKDGKIVAKRCRIPGLAEHWHNADDKRHRDDDLPATTVYNNGEVRLQAWYKNGLQHRDEDKPSQIDYKDGKITHRQWHRNGIEYTPIEGLLLSIENMVAKIREEIAKK